MEVEVQDGDITVWLPCTSFAVTYYRPKKSRHLLAKCIPGEDHPRVAMTHAEFLEAAWRLANHQARELGWIV
jgi:hypothetical protein